MNTQAANANNQAPTGWLVRGSHPKDYEVTVDKTIAHSGQASGSIKSSHSQPQGFGTLMQKCKAEQYRGQRLRMSAYAKAEGVVNWAGLWLRVDGAADQMLGFDNMENRPIQGTSEWKLYEIVLDVPAESLHLAFGVLLTGEGQVWIDDIQFEAVGPDVLSTGQPSREQLLPLVNPHPVNLNFEEA